jgi:hypothetical protein
MKIVEGITAEQIQTGAAEGEAAARRPLYLSGAVPTAESPTCRAAGAARRQYLDFVGAAHYMGSRFSHIEISITRAGGQPCRARGRRTRGC